MQKLEVEASKVMTRDAIDKMQAELAAAKQISDRELEEQRIELERYETTLREREKLIEMMKLLQNQQPQQPPVVNVHVPEPKPRRMKVKRDKNGAIEELGDAD